MNEMEWDALRRLTQLQLTIAIRKQSEQLLVVGGTVRTRPTDTAALLELLTTFHEWRVCYASFATVAAELEAASRPWVANDLRTLRQDIDAGVSATTRAAVAIGVSADEVARLEKATILNAFIRRSEYMFDKTRVTDDDDDALEPVGHLYATAISIVKFVDATIGHARTIQRGITDDQLEQMKLAEFTSMYGANISALTPLNAQMDTLAPDPFVNRMPTLTAIHELHVRFLKEMTGLAPVAEALAIGGRGKLMELIQWHVSDRAKSCALYFEIVANRAANERVMHGVQYDAGRAAVDVALRINEGWKAAFAGGKLVRVVVKPVESQ